MIKKRAAVLAIIAFLLSVAASLAQDSAQSQKPQAKTAAKPPAPNNQNIDAYIKLLRKDVRSQKSAVMSEVMQLDPDQAAKFWPIYRDYGCRTHKSE